MSTTTTKKKTRRVKLRALQQLFYGLDLIEEGQVFVFEGESLPSEEIAAPVPDDTPVGFVPVLTQEPSKDPPPWTTKGFVDGQNRAMGRRDVSPASPEATP